MPTARLSYDDKMTIQRSFHRTLSKATNSYPFPLKESDPITQTLGMDMLPDETRAVYDRMLRLDKELVAKPPEWRAWFYAWDWIRGEGDIRYRIEGFGLTVPKNGLILPNTHPCHADIVKWASNWHSIKVSVQLAVHYLNDAVEACTTIGQLKRVLPEDFMRYMPESLTSTLGDAERGSRVPRSFTPDATKCEALGKMLTIGSLAPDTLPDGNLRLEVDGRENIMEQEQ